MAIALKMPGTLVSGAPSSNVRKGLCCPRSGQSLEVARPHEVQWEAS
jgi:hypothetical protein